MNFEVVALTADGALGAQYTHMAGAGQFADAFGGGANDAQHAPLRVNLRQVDLLDGAQCLGRCRVARQDDEVTTHVEEPLHCLQGKFVHDLEGARAVGRTRVVSEI